MMTKGNKAVICTSSGRKKEKIKRCSFILYAVFIIASISYLWLGMIAVSLDERSLADACDSRIEQMLETRKAELEREFTERVERLVKDRLATECNKQPDKSFPVRITKSEKQEAQRLMMATSTTEASSFDLKIVGEVAAGMAAVPTSDFMNSIDLGLPIDDVKGKKDMSMSNVLVLYGSRSNMPKSVVEEQKKRKQQSSIPILSEDEALEHCSQLVVLPVQKKHACLALVPYQDESLHAQKWMRIEETKTRGKYVFNGRNQTLRLAPPRITNKGMDQFVPPDEHEVREGFAVLRKYFALTDEVVNDLKHMIDTKKLVPYQRVSPMKIITVMVSNFGQSEMILNFACNARARGLDTSSVLVFATDKETLDLADSLGLAAYYNEKLFGHIPNRAAGAYGDKIFAALMTLKILSVHIVSHLGYDLLFQDADTIWFQDPLRDYFANKEIWDSEYDVIFQDDGARGLRFAPYFANSGFYFMRNNVRTRAYADALLFSMTHILSTRSHQQVLIAVLSEHVSLFGLRVKVVSRDSNDLPCGFHWHQRPEFIRSIFSGDVHPIVFHMSWTRNKENKVKFFQQMGEWYVNDQCIGKNTQEVNVGNRTKSNFAVHFVQACCSLKPKFKCHYRDKPSVHDCSDSPPIDSGGKSFWAGRTKKTNVASTKTSTKRKLMRVAKKA